LATDASANRDTDTQNNCDADAETNWNTPAQTGALTISDQARNANSNARANQEARIANAEAAGKPNADQTPSRITNSEATKADTDSSHTLRSEMPGVRFAATSGAVCASRFALDISKRDSHSRADPESKLVL
jgi:hypothetical protein